MNDMTITTPTITNGVNVTALGQTIDAIRKDASIADFKFRLQNAWHDADHNRSTISGFYGAKEEQTHDEGPFRLDCGEPLALHGAGKAPNPVEYVLHALAGCLTTTMVFHAASRGIEVEAVASELEGDIDVRGFLGLSNEVRNGFSTVRVNMKVKSEAPADKLRELAMFSPVYDIVSNSLPVEVNITKV